MRTPRFGRRLNGKDLKRSSANCRAAATEPKTFIPGLQVPSDVAVARYKGSILAGRVLEPYEAVNPALFYSPMQFDIPFTGSPQRSGVLGPARVWPVKQMREREICQSFRAAKHVTPTIPPPEPDSLSSSLKRNIRALEDRRRQQAAAATWEERIAEAITRFTGSMRFVYLHVVLFGA